MMANTSALRKKGTPPRRENNPNLIRTNPRSRRVKNKPLQLMVPPDVFLAFSARAGEEFGFIKGSKSRLFLAMWKKYNSS